MHGEVSKNIVSNDSALNSSSSAKKKNNPKVYCGDTDLSQVCIASEL